MCETICHEIGDSYKGPFTLEIDSVSRSISLSFKGEKGWFRAHSIESGVEVKDNMGKSLCKISGIYLPTPEKGETLSISENWHNFDDIFAGKLTLLNLKLRLIGENLRSFCRVFPNAKFLK
ncbi:hypothetical protein HYY75_12925 [bacterium]|nr:hypothetical protein [bacterium]